VPLAAQPAQGVGGAQLEHLDLVHLDLVHLDLATDRAREPSAQPGNQPPPRTGTRPAATPERLSLLTHSTLLGASAKPWHPRARASRLGVAFPRPPRQGDEKGAPANPNRARTRWPVR